ncbi:hypothetical protein Hypma_006202 [Hypsizygus marmoreus]|uniref:Uncharacterized protein n=1 Tax=Hypsizygus marmoreus TaxID=39966 RepID=A0A369K2S2_HYPMA|nr:hypothetical protein Hypma_006202 [Hypsizygus marmoreus]
MRSVTRSMQQLSARTASTAVPRFVPMMILKVNRKKIRQHAGQRGRFMVKTTLDTCMMQVEIVCSDIRLKTVRTPLHFLLDIERSRLAVHDTANDIETTRLTCGLSDFFPHSRQL